MKAIRKLGNRRALSPVIATVILVAVAITVAVAVSYWMSGIASQYTKFEKVEIQSQYAAIGPNNWGVSLQLKNSGSAESTLIRCFVNDKPIEEYSPEIRWGRDYSDTLPGTITDITNNVDGATVTGSTGTAATNFVADFVAGDLIQLPDGNWYEVDVTPTAPDSLTITGSYPDYGADPLTSGDYAKISPMPDAGITLKSGQSKTVYVVIPLTELTFTSGTTINIKIHSAAGMDYIKLVQLT